MLADNDKTLNKRNMQNNPSYSRIRTQYSQKKNAVHAITFEAREYDDSKMISDSWTHGQLNLEAISEQEHSIPSQFRGASLTLPFYVSEIQRTQSNRIDILPINTYTKEFMPQAYIDSWGWSTPQWALKGNTGWGTRYVYLGNEQVGIDGYMTFVALYLFFENYQKENLYRLQEGKMPVQLLFYNWADTFQDMWYVEPIAVPTKQRSSDKPLLYNYDIQLIGVKPYTSTIKVSDDIAKAISNYNVRCIAVSESLSKNIDTLNSLESTVPKSLRSDFGSLMTDIEDIQSATSVGLSGLQTVASDVKNTVKDVNIFMNGLSAATRGILSPVFTLTNTFKQVRCGLLTLIKLPTNIEDAFKSDINNLINAVTASGCGTTLRQGAIGNRGKLGYSSLLNTPVINALRATTGSTIINGVTND